MWRPLGCLIGPHPRWAVIVLTIGGGTAFGIGATSILFLAADLMTPGFRWVELVVEIAVLAWLVYASIQRGKKTEKPEPKLVATSGSNPRPHSNPGAKPGGFWNLMMAGALVLVLVTATGAMSGIWDRNPQGNWDAWSIWNLRAKFLAAPNVVDMNSASPTAASRAWSPLLTGTHPEYPLLLSGAVARCWAFSSSGLAPSDAVPIAIAYIFFLSLIAVVTGGIAIARGTLAGLVAGLTLASTTTLLHEVPSQYADVPVAAYLACSAVFLLIDRPIWAGVFAGFAAWTKDEGALFCVVSVFLFAVVCWWDKPRRGNPLRLVLGILPGALTFGLFKVFLAPHGTAQFSAGALSRFADAGRWEVVLAGVGTQISSLGAGWFHPGFIVFAFAIAVGRRTDSRREAQFSAALAFTMLAGYCVAMVTSPDDAAWQTGTAAGRLMVQWWPLGLIAMMMWLRPAEELAVLEPAAKSKRR
jgi:hypothetical protein